MLKSLLLSSLILFGFSGCEYEDPDKYGSNKPARYEADIDVNTFGKFFRLSEGSNYLSVNIPNKCEVEIKVNYDDYNNYSLHEMTLESFNYETSDETVTLVFYQDTYQEDYYGGIDMDMIRSGYIEVDVWCY